MLPKPKERDYEENQSAFTSPEPKEPCQLCAVPVVIRAPPPISTPVPTPSPIPSVISISPIIAPGHTSFKRQGDHDYKVSEKNTKRTKRKQRKHNIDNMKMTQNVCDAISPPSPTPSIVAIGVTSTGSATCTTVFLLETNENHRCASRLGGLCQGSLSSFSSGGRCLMIFSYSNLQGSIMIVSHQVLNSRANLSVKSQHAEAICSEPYTKTLHPRHCFSRSFT